MSKKISLEEVKKHKTSKDAWLVIRGKVYDVTAFLDDHPGGEEVLLEQAGKADATQSFDDVGHSEEAVGMLTKYYVGDLEGASASASSNSSSSSNKNNNSNSGKSAPKSDGVNPLLYLIPVVAAVAIAYKVFQQ